VVVQLKSLVKHHVLCPQGYMIQPLLQMLWLNQKLLATALPSGLMKMEILLEAIVEGAIYCLVVANADWT
jgi:hypothetical protein